MARPDDTRTGDETVPRPRRVVVLGTSGSGKSTLAARLAELLGADHVELDAFNHGPNWTPRPAEEFAAGVADVVARPAWVVDGNYISRVSDSLWPAADLVVWLDLPLWVILPRIVRRTVRRIRAGTELWGGNRERWGALLGRESLLVWAVQSQRRHKAELPAKLAALARAGVRVVRLTSGRDADRWLAEQAAC
jgi:adenylate kinase family enzyme